VKNSEVSIKVNRGKKNSKKIKVFDENIEIEGIIL
jgi:hypothetical protein